ncbi:hypothetical protein BH10BAC3_BH10BAC3_14710 [soil metagenome]
MAVVIIYYSKQFSLEYTRYRGTQIGRKNKGMKPNRFASAISNSRKASFYYDEIKNTCVTNGINHYYVIQVIL